MSNELLVLFDNSRFSISVNVLPMISSSLVSKLRKITTPVSESEMERCHFCGSILPTEHRHLADIANMKFICTCEMCLVKNAESGSYTPLPQRSLQLKNFIMSDQLWSDFLIPVNMAFFIKSTVKQGTIAYYPAPTGATESKLKMHAWNNLIESNPVLNEMMPDLEALLVNRLQDEGQYYIVPVDSCYQLVGMIRVAWRGIFGGNEVNNIINRFFGELKEKSTYA